MSVAIDAKTAFESRKDEFDSEFEPEASEDTFGSGEPGPARLCIASWYCSAGSWVWIP